MTKDQFAILKVFQERLKDRPAMPMDEFVQLALYHESNGYYSKKQERVGKGTNSDFYTSNTFGSLWGELIIEACGEILSNEDIRKYTFVEIAAEPNCSILDNIEHPFSSSITYRLGDSLEIPSPAIVFSNEWLDAQPFKRFRFHSPEKRWREVGVRLEKGELSEYTFMEKIDPIFPVNSVDGYTIDWPTGAHQVLDNLISKSWHGLFLTFDYGLPKPILMNERPDGTARAYYKHQFESNLFARPGEQDLTCHLCWDELSNTLSRHNFKKIELQNQESFFMHHAQNKIKSLIENPSNSVDLKVQKLKEIIHPQHFGSKFQALSALR
ncbi:MAG: SAM-dependent methyltransferase [Opitutales bacterium]